MQQHIAKNELLWRTWNMSANHSMKKEHKKIERVRELTL